MRRVLAGVDSSKQAEGVVRTAVGFAKQFGGTLVLFRAIAIPPEFPPAAATDHADALGPKLIADAEKQLQALADLVGTSGIVTSISVVSSTEPWRAIIATADSIKADVIVIGSHGYHAIDRLLGTTAARVADRAHCLVVIVHESTEPVTAEPARSGPYRTIS